MREDLVVVTAGQASVLRFVILIGNSAGRYSNMDIDIIDETDNPMLHRTDVRFEMVHDEATPSRLSVRDSLAAKLNKDSTEVVVRKLDTKFGMRKTLGSARVYEGPDYASDIEQDHMLERNKITGNGEAEASDDSEDAAEETEEETEEDIADEADAAAEDAGDEAEDE